MALGKIKADTLEHSTAGSLDTQYVVNGSAKAWVNFNGTVPSLTDSFNIASVVDNGTGDHQVNISNSMSNGNYSIFASCGPTVGSNNMGVSFQNTNTPPTSTLFRPVTRRRDNATDYDVSYAYCQVQGDLA